MSTQSSTKIIPKKLSNRFDEYEICHIFTESTQEYIQKTSQPIHSKFIIKSILGVILALNAYLSHWGPWPWPSNYYIILASIIIYYVGSTIYSKLTPIENSNGNLIGQYDYKGNKTFFVMSIGDNKMEYTLELLGNQDKKSIGKKTFLYYEYFTEKGLFLEQRYRKNLSGFLSTINK